MKVDMSFDNCDCGPGKLDPYDPNDSIKKSVKIVTLR